MHMVCLESVEKDAFLIVINGQGKNRDLNNVNGKLVC
jgi:hypothetical protein